MRKALLFVLACLPLRALAIGYFYPVGHYEAVMGASGTAMVGSPLGLIYNPSLLGTLENPSFSISGSSYMIFRAETGANRYSSFTSVPNSVVSSWQIGSGSLAIGVIVPKSMDADSSTTFAADLFFPGAPGDIYYKYSSVTERTMIGGAWGKRVAACGADCEVYAGGSLFFSYDSIKRQTFLSYENPTVGATAVQASTSAATTSLLSMIGATWVRDRRSAVAVRLELPSILLKTDSGGEQISHTYDSTKTPPFTMTKAPSGDFTPSLDRWTLSVGGWWQLGDRWTVTADTSVGEAAKKLSESEDTDAPLDVGGGARYRISESLAAYAGSRLDLSGYFNVDSENEYKFVQLGFSAGMSWVNKDLESLAGVFTNRFLASASPSSERAKKLLLDPATVDHFGLMLSAQYKF